MSYSTRAEVRDMVKDDALNAIIGDTFIEDPAEREELVSPIIDAAIADADAEIDGYLAKRYAVPLSPAPKVINKFSKDIAVYNLFSRIGIDESTDQKTYLNRYNAAIKFFELVADGHGSRRPGKRSRDRVLGEVKHPAFHPGQHEGDVGRV